MNIDEIALRVWCANNTCMPADGMNKLKEFAHALLAELSKDAEPVGYMREIRPGEFKYSCTSSWGPDVWKPLFLHPTPVIASEQKPVDVVPPAWTNLIEYVLQDDLHNRLTPRVVDIAYTAFMLTKQPSIEDGGNSDWFNDTKPSVMKAIAKLRKDLVEFTSSPNTADIEQKPVAWVDVIDRHEGPYNFNGLELLDSGKHLLFTSPPNTADIEQRVAEACAKMIQGWSCTNGPSIAEAIRLGKWREYL